MTEVTELIEDDDEYPPVEPDPEFDQRMAEGAPYARAALEIWKSRAQNFGLDVEDRAVAAYYAHHVEQSFSLFGCAVVDKAHLDTGSLYPSPGHPSGAPAIESIKLRVHEDKGYILLVRYEGHLAAAVRAADMHVYTYMSCGVQIGHPDYEVFGPLEDLAEHEWLEESRVRHQAWSPEEKARVREARSKSRALSDETKASLLSGLRARHERAVARGDRVADLPGSTD